MTGAKGYIEKCYEITRVIHKTQTKTVYENKMHETTQNPYTG